jgi:predicted SnoaL-like aldol condensation-catalyzing enzyme
MVEPSLSRTYDPGLAAEEATAKFVSSAYVQHNPRIADGSVALGKYFGQLTRERAKARVVVHRIIAVGDYVWAHVNFLNLFNDDPDDTGIAAVDIYKMDAERKSDRALGHTAAGRRPQKLGPLGRAQCAPRQSKRNVLKRKAGHEQHTR